MIAELVGGIFDGRTVELAEATDRIHVEGDGKRRATYWRAGRSNDRWYYQADSTRPFVRKVGLTTSEGPVAPHPTSGVVNRAGGTATEARVE